MRIKRTNTGPGICRISENVNVPIGGILMERIDPSPQLLERAAAATGPHTNTTTTMITNSTTTTTTTSPKAPRTFQPYIFLIVIGVFGGIVFFVCVIQRIMGHKLGDHRDEESRRFNTPNTARYGSTANDDDDDTV